MSATTISTNARVGTPIPFSRLVKVELRKTTDTRAGRWLLIAIGAITFIAIALFVAFAKAEDLKFRTLVLVAGTPQGFLLPVLGILAITSEWSQRTGLTTFTLEPSRQRVLTSKIVAVLLLGFGAILFMLTLAALANVIGGTLTDEAGSWAGNAAVIRNVFVLQILGLLGGLAFGTILLNSAPAIVLSFIAPTLMGVVVNIVPGLSGAAPWIDAGTAQGPLFDFDGSEVTWEAWGQILVTSFWWVWIPLAAGTYRVLRTELK